ncbi:hypothetical protein [Congregibacter litoralis]|nr:hypothetical protein [Congregibacter litoralis]
MAETPLSWATSPADLNIETPEEPEWVSKIDTNKPECKELAEEMLRLQAKGELGDIVYLGDCTRMPLNDTP